MNDKLLQQKPSSDQVTQISQALTGEMVIMFIVSKPHIQNYRQYHIIFSKINLVNNIIRFSPSISEVNNQTILQILYHGIQKCVIFSFIMPCYDTSPILTQQKTLSPIKLLTVLGFTIFRVILRSDFSLRFPFSCPFMIS